MNPEQKDILEKCTKSKEDTSFKGIATFAKCVDVHDGDTCRLKFFYRNEITQCPVRLLGIDTPEMKPSTMGRTQQSLFAEKQAAIHARDELTKLICGSGLIYVKFEEYDKYGRPLVTIYNNSNTEEKSINAMMLEKGYGVKYDGGRKHGFDEKN